MAKRYAIVIGSNNYQKLNPLKCTLKDAEDMKNILIKRCRFEAEHIKLLTFELGDKESISKIDEDFEKIKKVFIKGQDNFLFYFSGHGRYDKNAKSSYIYLSDAESYSLKDIYAKITVNLKGKHSYMIIDACEAGANPKSFAERKQERKIQHHFKGVYCLFGATEKTLSYEPTLNQSQKLNIKNGFLTHFFKKALEHKPLYFGEKRNTNILSITGYIQQQIKEEILPYFEQVPKAIIESIGDDEFAFWDEKEEEIKPKEKPKLAFQIDSSDYELIDLVVEAEINWDLFFSLISDFDEEKSNLHQNYFEPIGKILDKHIEALIKRSDAEILFFIDALHTNLSLYRDWAGGDWKTWDIYVNVVNEIFNHWKNNIDIQVAGFCFLWYLTAIKESYNAKNFIVSILKAKTYNEETKDFYKSIAQDIDKRKIIFRGNLYEAIENEITIPKPIRDITKKIKEEEPYYNPFLTNDKIDTNLPF
jgi:hypothetical protein